MRRAAHLHQLDQLHRIRDLMTQAAELRAAEAGRGAREAERAAEAETRAGKSSLRAWTKSVAAHGHASALTAAWAGAVVDQQDRQVEAEQERDARQSAEQRSVLELRAATALREVAKTALCKAQVSDVRKRDEQRLSNAEDRSAQRWRRT